MKRDEYILKGNGIQLISLPPTLVNFPISGLSTLKSYVNKFNINCNVRYLNISVDENCFFKSCENDFMNLLPYIYLYNRIVLDDDYKSFLTKVHIESFYGKVFYKDKSLTNDIFDECIEQLINHINTELDDLIEKEPALIGFTSKFYQWIPACVCAHLIKKKNPNIPILIGGWSHKDAALSILKVFPDFDYAIWGEGEMPIVDLYNSIKNDCSKTTIARLIYKEGNLIISSGQSERETFVDLNTAPVPDFEDYIIELQNRSIPINFSLPVERSRGCNWNKCHFCYLSVGYNYRIKDNEKFIEQVTYLIEKYNIFLFQIMDNDFVGKDIEVFRDLLEKLKLLKKKFPEFKIILAEIITKDLSKEIIEMMFESGIENVQIGLEAISQNILTKMNKYQSVAENIFFIREALLHGISISGANIIIETLDEDDEDIIESINMLYFFRFFLSNEKLKFDETPLAIANYSSYRKRIKNKNIESEYNSNHIADLLPVSFTSEIDRFSLFDYTSNTSVKLLWQIFSKSYKTYIKNKHSYKINYKNGVIYYKEYSNRKLIKEICFDDIFTIRLLYILQDKVFSVDELYEKIIIELPEGINGSFTKVELIKILSDLYHEGLVFYNKDFSQITTIIILNELAYE